jgi:dienelactone hydrolase
MRRIFAIIFAALGAGCAAETLTFPSAEAPGTPTTMLRGKLVRPNGVGPHPAVVLLHGCSGWGRHYDAWSQRLADWGYVALAVDSLGPRNYQSICTQGSAVPPSVRARDAEGAAAYLRSQPFVQGDRIGVIGHSHGGWTALRIAQGEVGKPFRAVVAYYPYCDVGSQRQVAIPTLVLIGELDDWTPAARCRALEPALPRRELASFIYYPNAFHSFDADFPLRFTQGSDGRMHRAEPDREAMADSFARTRAFFDRHLKP